MGRNIIDITGNRYGKLTVVSLCDNDEITSSGRKEKLWNCICDCGNKKIANGNRLKSGKIKSCGCLSKQKDITGNVYGDLTVISILNKNNKTRCICKCSCGNECDVNYYDLINGKKTNCGCKKKKDRPDRIKDLSGQVFGYLTVIKRDEKEYYTSGGTKLYKWICKCQCGNTISVERSKLKSGHTKSCGCIMAKIQNKSFEEYQNSYGHLSEENTGKLKDITGQKFGKLIPISRIKEVGQKAKWLCDCECGGKAIVQTSNLLNGHTQSCGCIDSVGELLISNILNKNNIEYKKEFTFKDCKDKHPLPFDFAVMDKGVLLCLIEYDGKQHFEISRFNGMSLSKAKESFELCQKHDIQKNEYCKSKNIPLLRIKYTQKDNIEEIITKYIEKIKSVNKVA